MEASTSLPTPTLTFSPNTDKIKRNLLKKGVYPTPKIIHTLGKKEIQKFNRKSKKLSSKTLDNPISESQKQQLSEQTHFKTIKREYKEIKKVLKAQNGDSMAGKPWERNELRELAGGWREYGGVKLKGEALVELSEFFAERRKCDDDDKNWLLDEDIEQEEWMESDWNKVPTKRKMGDDEAMKFLVKRLSATNLTVKDWKFSKLMKQSGLQFSEYHMLKIVDALGAIGCWRHALSVVSWVYNHDECKRPKSRFVYTKLLAVLGKARKPTEALHIFNLMRNDCRIYPDMAAYHSISVTLGQAGLVQELVKVIEWMRMKPSKKVKSMRSKDWDPSLEPDVVVYNAVLNACVPSHQWKGVTWVMEEMRKSALKPNGATYGLAMEVMLRSGKYDLVHKFYEKMRRSGAPPKAITYKVLVRTFWEEGKINEAVEAVRDMERRGVVGTASVYYELACCLCKSGRWKEAMVEVEKLKMLRPSKPLEVAFTGMITACMDGGHVDDCVSIFQQMCSYCTPNIGTINAMLRVYGLNDMFSKAKELFENLKGMEFKPTTQISGGRSSLTPDAFTYSSILEASARAHCWEYFEHVYKEMLLCGYPLDQTKHAWLLVEASKAGKGHLLEHAFDLILEAGEVPDVTFFTEMACQATAQDNYKEAVNLLNGMAHASFRIGEKQWTDICTGWQDRVRKDGLQKLFDELCSSGVVAEDTISNLLKTLQSMCRLESPTDTDLIALSKFSTDRLPSGRRYSDGFSELDVSPVCINNSIQVDVDPSYMPNPPSCVVNSKSKTSFRGRSDDIASSVPHSFVGCSSLSLTVGRISEDYIEETLDVLTNHSNGSGGSDLPTASEILKRWKENRNKDGIFLPFQEKSK